jgi:hypothetical protein
MLNLYRKLDGYEKVLFILKDLGDAVAFVYIDKYDIKPRRFKEPSGFISGKSGLRKELLIFQKVFKLGGIGILNDLTHCLRYGDITAGNHGKMFATIEVKSGKNRNQRAVRQFEGIKKITNYLKTDETRNLYGIDGEFHRIEAKGEEVSYKDKLDVIIRKARKCGLFWEEVEKGLFYVVLRKNDLDWINELAQKCKGKAMIAMIDELKWQNSAYYPFTLSFRDPNTLWDFYIGKMLIAIVVDTGVMKEYFLTQGLRIEFLDEEVSFFEIFDNNKKADESIEWKQYVSRPFFTRLFAEFLGLEWMCNQISLLAKSLPEIVAGP